ncbi:MAG: hypothetical protein ACUVUC_10155 [Thermoguttaceae bacterium]
MKPPRQKPSRQPGQTIPRHRQEPGNPPAPAVPPLSVASELPPIVDTWEQDEQLRHIGRLLSLDDLDTLRPDALRLHAAHRKASAGHLIRRSKTPWPDPHPPLPWAQRALGFLAWFCTLLGMMSVSCGGVLWGWSALAGREELRRIGNPIGLGGLVVLALGFLLQLDRSWQRPASEQAEPSGTAGPDPQTAPAIPPIGETDWTTFRPGQAPAP